MKIDEHEKLIIKFLELIREGDSALQLARMFRLFADPA